MSEEDELIEMAGAAAEWIDRMLAWLRGVLDDVEREANAVSNGPNKPEKWIAEQYKGDPRGYRVAGQHSVVVDGAHRADADHIARNDPAHVLNTVVAHRKMLDRYERIRASAMGKHMSIEHEMAWRLAENALRGTVRWLVFAYQDREGYQQEWRP